MPERFPKNTSPDAAANHADGPTLRGLLRALALRWNAYRRLVVWAGLALILTVALRSASHHFLNGGGDKQDGDNSTAAGHGFVRQPHGAWWKPSGNSDNDWSAGADPEKARTVYMEGGGRSVIPVDRNPTLTPGNLTVNGLAASPIGTYREAYQILGLGTSSTPSSIPLLASIHSPASPSDLSFSLSANLTQVPVDNLAPSAMSAEFPAPVPEPSCAGLLMAGLGGLMVRCRNRHERSI